MGKISESYRIPMYASKPENILGRGMKILRNDGLLQLIKSFVSMLNYKFIKVLAPAIVRLKKRKYFNFEGKKLEYLYHTYNDSWMSERTIEIPIAQYFINKTKGKKILEVGSVLGHYTNRNWEVVDKFEIGKGIFNQDICDYKTRKKYDVIICISTLEHVGYDDTHIEPDKSLRAIKSMKNCIRKNGEILITVPLGYNKYMDKNIYDNKIRFSKIHYFTRVDRKNNWTEINDIKNVKKQYGKPFSFGNLILVGVIKKI